MRIGSYEVLAELGRGGMGVVYRVRDAGGREAALKLLVGVDQRAFARFERERRLLAELGDAQGFVGLLDAGISPQGAWLVMSLVGGGTLRDRLRAGPLGVDETVAIGVQVARALGAAHARGIVHRDVKPENLLFAGQGRVLVADLGLAKHFDRGVEGASLSMSQTVHGTVKGTAGYMAPEQLEDASRAGPAADVFALGAVLYECLAGRPAFEGPNVVELLARVGSGVLEPIGRKDVPSWLERVVKTALSRQLGGRFADGAQLAEVLSRGAATKPGPGGRKAVLVGLALGVLLGGAGVGAVAIGLDRKAAGGRAPASPPAPPPTAPASAKALAERATEKLRVRDLDGAIADASRAIELDPKLALGWANRGSGRGDKEDVEGAIADTTRAIELDPRIASAWLSRGVARWKKKELDAAIADLTRAIELDPKLAVAWGCRGTARGSKNDWEGEITDETRALELEPNLASAWQCRGLARSERGDYEGAIADLGRALELAPGLAAAWLDRGVARFHTGDLAGSIADETRAIELDPSNPQAWRNRGGGRCNQGDLDGAIADETRAIELDPASTQAWSNRAIARHGKGDYEGAIADAEHALELQPVGSGAEQMRRLLDEARKHVR